MLKGKTVLLGVCGGIAAYKACELASLLVKQHAEVHVIMTKNAEEFVRPLTFEALTKHRCVTDTFDREHPEEVTHIALAQKADLVLIAPATANIAAKLAHGICDDMMTSTVLAARCPKVIAPAMNTNMYENPVTQDNLERLSGYGWTVIEPVSGLLACGDTGKGKFPDPQFILQYVLKELAFEKDLAGLRVLVTAGPTREALAPVRYITNHSSGKMGYAIARIAAFRGADVTLVSGPTALEIPAFTNFVSITSAEDLFREVTARSSAQDIIIKAAAVADYRPSHVADEKIRKSDSDMFIPLERTPDTLRHLGSHKQEGQLLCGFAMETSNLEERAREKLKKKNLDLIVGNNVKVPGAGFGTDTNVVTLITEDSVESPGIMSKEEVAGCILDKLLSLRKQG